jgi:hypothetical protein
VLALLAGSELPMGLVVSELLAGSVMEQMMVSVSELLAAWSE